MTVTLHGRPNANGFVVSYIDPISLKPPPNMAFGSNDEFQAWNEGPPPFPGWWNAHYSQSDAETLEIWRWWNGERWSCIAKSDFDAKSACMRAAIPVHSSQTRLHVAIKWNDRWPVGARVPRLIPEGHPLECYAGMIGGTVAESSPQLSLPLDDKPLQQQLEESDW